MESMTDRCDHCKKWVSQDRGVLGSLEGIVAKSDDINFAICLRCFERNGCGSAYWDAWVTRKKR